MKGLVSSIALVLLANSGLVHGLAKEAYPRIVENPRGCWNYTAEMPNDLRICDPDRIVSLEQTMKLHDMAAQIRALPTCPCSRYVCQIEKFSGRRRGYTVTIALVRSMETGTGDLIASAGNYTVYLRNERGYGNLARCQDDIIVFLSYKEKVLYILTGNMAMGVVTNAEVADIIQDSKSHFTPEVAPGMEEILRRIKQEILNG